MFRSSVIAAPLAGFLWSFLCAPSSAASEAADLPNNCFVLYTKILAPGTLNARWMYSTKYSGPGISTGWPKACFAGNYHVRYFYDSGKFSDEYDLVIAKTGDMYKVSWISKGK